MKFSLFGPPTWFNEAPFFDKLISFNFRLESVATVIQPTVRDFMVFCLSRIWKNAPVGLA